MTYFAPHLPGLIPRRALISTTFSESFYPVGQPPSDWSEVTNIADWNTLIEVTNLSLFGNALKFNRGAANVQTYVWNTAQPCGDVEILFRAHKAEGAPDNAALLGCCARLQLPTNNNGSTLTLATALLLEGHEDWLGKWVNGAQTTLGQYNGTHVGTGTGNWWWQRTRFVGNSMQTKHWVFGAAEPAYQPTEDMGAGVPAEGHVGLFTNNNIDTLVDYFAVSLGGPGSPPIPIPLPVGGAI